MVSGFQITCANKNMQGDIVRVGGQGWSLSTREAVAEIADQRLRLYIRIGNEYFDISIRGHGHNAYLVLESDERPLRDVEGLPSC